MNSRRCLITMAGTLASVAILLAMPVRSHAQEGFDLRKLQQVIPPAKHPAKTCIEMCVGWLRDEIANPSPDRWGMAGGPIASAYIQATITGALSFPGAEEPALLRKYRDGEPKGRLRDCLTIALSLTGAMDTADDLVRIMSKESDGAIRCVTTRALGKLLIPPRPSNNPLRLRPGEEWKPLDAKQTHAVTKALLTALSDPYKTYRGVRQHDDGLCFPVQVEAARRLATAGFTVKHTIKDGKVTGWRVTDRSSKLMRSVELGTPYRSHWDEGMFD